MAYGHAPALAADLGAWARTQTAALRAEHPDVAARLDAARRAADCGACDGTGVVEDDPRDPASAHECDACEQDRCDSLGGAA